VTPHIKKSDITAREVPLPVRASMPFYAASSVIVKRSLEKNLLQYIMN
jgi:hypothetical protein